MNSFTVDQLRESNKALALENDNLREQVKCLKGDNEILQSRVTKMKEEQKGMDTQCAEYAAVIKCRERDLKELGEINAAMSEEITKLKRPLTVSTLLKELSKNGANSVMIGLK